MVLKREKRVGRTRIKEDGKYMHRSRSHRPEERGEWDNKKRFTRTRKRDLRAKILGFFPWCVPR